ncbi:hypothetical protein MHYP_G00180400 [Metynnis hypsauchen]
MKSICLKSSEEKPLQKHLDHLESSDEVVKAICELLEVLFEDVLSASVQPLENEMISKVAAEAEAEAEAVDALMSASVKDEKEEHLDKPLEKDVICTTDAEAQPEATTDTPNVCLEETQAKDNQLLSE